MSKNPSLQSSGSSSNSSITLLKASSHSPLEYLQDFPPPHLVFRQLERPSGKFEQICEVRLGDKRKTTGNLVLFAFDLRLEVLREVFGDVLGALDDFDRYPRKVGHVSAERRARDTVDKLVQEYQLNIEMSVMR